MAERRMFSKSIIGSARFLRMPPSSRLLYYDLGMYADDDGVVEAFSVMKQTSATEDDLRVLVSKGFVKVLNDDLVTLITDWNTNNLIRNDRYHPSIYNDLLLKLTDGIPSDNQVTTNGIPRLGKDRIGKDRLGKDRAMSADMVEQVMSAWNELPINNITKIGRNTQRYKMLNARISEYGIDAVLEAINLISQSPFLLGRVTDFVITFDWFVKPNNFIKVYEGNYANRGTETKNEGRLDWIDDL